ncbi:MAG: RluA family pseudouridine synthase [Verrucomicrobiota bacterium]
MAKRILEFEVAPGVDGGRADKVFAAEFDDVSRARLQRAFDEGLVTFRGEVIDKKFKINSPGLLRAVLDDPDASEGPSAVDLPLNVVHEDESIIVINKASGMITHPGNGTGDDTLVHALLHHCNDRLSSVGAPERPGIVHRLDKETSGLIVVAKTDLAHHRLADAFSQRETYKRYTALVFGLPKRNAGTCKEPIGRHPVVRTRMAVMKKGGRNAHTDWKVVRAFDGLAAEVACVIHTGRTHQIRVHMSYMDHPLLGDVTYGFKANRLSGIEIPRVMLHSAELRLVHPLNGEPMTFLAPLPDDFKSVMAALEMSSN